MVAGNSGQSCCVVDDFTRDLLGDDWTIYNGDVGIVNKQDVGVLSKVVELRGMGLAAWSGTACSADQFSEATISVAADARCIYQVFVRRRESDRARYGFHCVLLDADGQLNPNPEWGLKLDGVPGGTVLAAVSGPRLLPGDTLRIEARGNVIRGLHNGVELLSAWDDTLTEPGQPGIVMNVALVTSFPAPVYSCWRGGNL